MNRFKMAAAIVRDGKCPKCAECTSDRRADLNWIGGAVQEIAGLAAGRHLRPRLRKLVEGVKKRIEEIA